MTEPGPGQRLDKWLWGARFFKTRSLAGRQCEGGRMRVDGATRRFGPAAPPYDQSSQSATAIRRYSPF